ncbi:hypothetical protein L227DRAFT_529510, partial [Lentinus tigrinus ALCF2SS1-6]
MNWNGISRPMSKTSRIPLLTGTTRRNYTLVSLRWVSTTTASLQHLLKSNEYSAAVACFSAMSEAHSVRRLRAQSFALDNGAYWILWITTTSRQSHSFRSSMTMDSIRNGEISGTSFYPEAMGMSSLLPPFIPPTDDNIALESCPPSTSHLFSHLRNMSTQQNIC